MKLNLGCGTNKRSGYTNVDSDPSLSPDLCFDLTEPNWPIEDNTVDDVFALHILEHLETTKGYLTFWKELYRVCKNGTEIKIEVPHWKADIFFHDPTHVRAVTPVGIMMFDQKRNHDLEKMGDGETKLGRMCKVDFSFQGANYQYDGSTGEPYTCQYMTKVVKPQRYYT